MSTFLVRRRATSHDHKNDAHGPHTPSNRDEGVATVLDAGEWEVHIQARGNQRSAVFKRFLGGDFICVVGTIVYQSRFNEAALIDLFQDSDEDGNIAGLTLGHHALLIYKAGRLIIRGDSAGAFKIFHSVDLNYFSSSFLVLASLLGDRSLDLQAACEYILSGAVLGSSSMLQEVKTVPQRAVCVLGRRPTEMRSEPIHLPTRSRAREDELVAEADYRLGVIFESILNAFDAKVTCALTAGYDSRLIFVNLIRRRISPRVFVYGRDDINVLIARQVAAEAKMRLDVINPKEQSSMAPEVFAGLVEQNFLDNDGYFYPGIFNAGGDIAGREYRTENGSVFLHGGAGEVFRNFFQLTNRPVSPKSLVYAAYAKFDVDMCRSSFDRENYFNEIETKMRAHSGRSESHFGRHLIEWLYPYFRCHAWFGRESSLNNSVGPTIFPFYEPYIADFACTIPVSMKQSGAFEGRLITLADPSIASLPSQYGHGFSGRVPWKKRIADHVKSATPPRLRPLLYSLREKRRPARRSNYLSDEYVRCVLPDGAGILNHLFNCDRVRDEDLYSRILTVAYLIRRLNVKTSIPGC